MGQTAVIDLRMSLSGVSETVTVTGEAPLVNTATSSLGGAITPRQITELPSQGRNWMSLALLAPGNRTNAQGATPVQDRVDVREFQLNVDGQQVTSNSIIPRESFVGDPIHRVDLRLQERVPLHSRAAISGYVEIFNLFNRANFQTYNVVETSPTFGQPNASTNLSYAPRTLQLGVRLTF